MAKAEEQTRKCPVRSRGYDTRWLESVKFHLKSGA
jgi:hypothetical protein